MNKESHYFRPPFRLQTSRLESMTRHKGVFYLEAPNMKRIIAAFLPLLSVSIVMAVSAAHAKKAPTTPYAEHTSEALRAIEDISPPVSGICSTDSLYKSAACICYRLHLQHDKDVEAEYAHIPEPLFKACLSVFPDLSRLSDVCVPTSKDSVMEKQSTDPGISSIVTSCASPYELEYRTELGSSADDISLAGQAPTALTDYKVYGWPYPWWGCRYTWVYYTHWPVWWKWWWIVRYYWWAYIWKCHCWWWWWWPV